MDDKYRGGEMKSNVEKGETRMRRVKKKLSDPSLSHVHKGLCALTTDELLTLKKCNIFYGLLCSDRGLFFLLLLFDLIVSLLR